MSKTFLKNLQSLYLPWFRSQYPVSYWLAATYWLAAWAGMKFCKKGPETESCIEHYGKEQKGKEDRLKREVGLSLSAWWWDRFGVSLVANMNDTLLSSFFQVFLGDGSWAFHKSFLKIKYHTMVCRWSRKACLRQHRSEETAWQCTITRLDTHSDRAEWLNALYARQHLVCKISFLNFFYSPIYSTYTISSALCVPSSLTRYPALPSG